MGDHTTDEHDMLRFAKKRIETARKINICFGSDQRAYVPERLRGKGVGYGKHGK